MVDWIVTKLKLEPAFSADMEYLDCIGDLINHEMVRSMKNYVQHCDIDCLEHSLYVSYSSYLICRRLGLDDRSAARGGLLHDFFLYDWHVKNQHRGLHGFAHPHIALQNANRYFQLNELEQDIISKHMWPLTISLPQHKEAFIVAMADKYCAFMEICNFRERRNVRRLQRLLCC